MIFRVGVVVVSVMLVIIGWLVWQNYRDVRDLQVPEAESPSEIARVIEFCKIDKHEGSPLCSGVQTPDAGDIQRRIEEVITTPFGGGSQGDTEIVVSERDDDDEDRPSSTSTSSSSSTPSQPSTSTPSSTAPDRRVELPPLPLPDPLGQATDDVKDLADDLTGQLIR